MSNSKLARGEEAKVVNMLRAFDRFWVIFTSEIGCDSRPLNYVEVPGKFDHVSLERV